VIHDWLYLDVICLHTLLYDEYVLPQATSMTYW